MASITHRTIKDDTTTFNIDCKTFVLKNEGTATVKVLGLTMKQNDFYSPPIVLENYKFDLNVKFGIGTRFILVQQIV